MCISLYRQRGLSLIELVMFIVIVSVGIVGILAVFNVGARASADPLPAKQALAIAEALMEEIQSAAFTWCDPDDANATTAASAADCASLPENLGPEAGDARPYDNVNDYHQPAPAPVTDLAGVAPTELAGYNYTVNIAAAALGSIPAADALRITVAVSGPGGAAVTLEGYRARHSPAASP